MYTYPELKLSNEPAVVLLDEVNCLKKRYRSMFKELDSMKNVDFYTIAPIVHKYINPFKNKNMLSIDECNDISARLSKFTDYLCSIYKWKRWKKIYMFNTDLMANLINQSDRTDPKSLIIPKDFLLNIPYETFFINANGFFDDMLEENEIVKNINSSDMIIKINGFFVRIDTEKETKRKILVFNIPMYICDKSYNLKIFNSMNHEIILDGESIQDCIQLSIDDKGFINTVTSKNNYTKLTMRCLTLLLYILAANSDITDGSINTYKPKKKNKSIIDAFSEIQQFNVGYRVGAALKQHGMQHNLQSYGNNGKKKIPHTRRGHWHHYWVGPRNSDHRELIVHWIPPIAVNSNWIDENPVGEVTLVK